MTPALQQALFAKYPAIFRDRTKPMTETRMCWGLEVGDGWYQLLDWLCAALEPSWQLSFDLTADGVKTEEGGDYWSPEPPQVVATQVKEKMGGLRFYHQLEFADHETLHARYPKALQQAYHDYGRFVEGIVHMAETMASVTCEVTGKPGELCVRGGWLKTLSPEEAAKQGYRPYAEVKLEEATAP